jgi:hypothetical protein
MTRNGKIARLPREIREQSKVGGHFLHSVHSRQISVKCSRSLQAAEGAQLKSCGYAHKTSKARLKSRGYIPKDLL